MELSLCMIVKNEEANLGRCLESVKDAVDEIVILDTGSTDGTKAVAAAFTNRIFDYAWRDDFAHARNTAFSYVTKPYLLWMDADDVLAAGGEERLRELKLHLDGSVDAVMLPYLCGVRKDGTPALSFERERIVRRDAGFFFEGAVHEAMAIAGNVLHEDIAIVHTGDHGARSNERNLAIYEKWIASDRHMAARDWHYYARELQTAGRFEEAERVFARVTAMDCWIENRIDAHMQRAHCLAQLGRRGEARAELLSALAVDTPRAEALCALGELETQEGRLAAAAFWYRAAMQAERPGGGAFVLEDCYDYVPLMQLCALYDRMGRAKEAAQMNERALIVRPGDPAAEQNRMYFEEKLAGQAQKLRENKQQADALEG